MALTPQAVEALAATLVAQHEKDLQRNGRLGKVKRYLAGDHDLPYAPRGAKLEYRVLAKKAITNWLPLIGDTFAKALFVDGYKPAKAADDSPAWDYWQANGLDARQSVLYRSAFDYGIAHLLILPGDSSPVMRPLTALKCASFFEDEDDDWPKYGLILKGADVDGSAIYEVLDDENVYTVTKAPKSDRFVYASEEAHGLGVCPLVRYRDRLDGEACGIVRPLITIQDRVNEAVFALMIAIQYASFRQRWATGLAIPIDENPYIDSLGHPSMDAVDPVSGGVNPTNPNFQKPIEPFQAAVDRLWVSDNPEAKFGDFAQTEVSGHIANYEGAVKTLAAIGQISPHVLLGDLHNLAADALAALNDSTTKKADEYAVIFGESHEQAFRLAAKAAGDSETATDTSAEVRWRDTEARSLAQTADALGKLATMLQVPVEGLWGRIPGVTDQEIEDWKALAKSGDGLKALADALTANSAPARPTTTNAPPPPPGAPTPPAP